MKATSSVFKLEMLRLLRSNATASSVTVLEESPQPPGSEATCGVLVVASLPPPRS